MIRTRYIIMLLLAAIATTACTEKSLQKYLVEKQDDPKFMKFDLATSLLDNGSFDLNAEDKEVLSSIRKINVIAYPLKNGDTEDFEMERSELESILKDDRYKDLTRVHSDNWSADFKYKGEEDAIDEVIIYANSADTGFALLRLHGKNMKPEHLMHLVEIFQKGDFDLSSFTGLIEGFRD